MSGELPPQEASKNPENLSVGERALAHVSEVLKARFEIGPLENRLLYHNEAHTKNVVTNAIKIGSALGLAPHELALVQIAASYHDVVQNWHAEDREDGSLFRKRESGPNEIQSYDEAIAWMKEESGQEWSESDFARIKDAILATTPTWDVELRTVVQKMLTPDCDPVLRAVALADISAPGMNPDICMQNTDSLFLEEQLDAIEALKQYQEGNLPEEKGVQIVERYKKWVDGQWHFVDGRRQRLEIELDGLSVDSKNTVRDLFSHFDDSLKLVGDHRTNIQNWTFEDFVKYVEPLMKKLNSDGYSE